MYFCNINALLGNIKDVTKATRFDTNVVLNIFPIRGELLYNYIPPPTRYHPHMLNYSKSLHHNIYSPHYMHTFRFALLLSTFCNTDVIYLLIFNIYSRWAVKTYCPFASVVISWKISIKPTCRPNNNNTQWSVNNVNCSWDLLYKHAHQYITIEYTWVDLCKYSKNCQMLLRISHAMWLRRSKCYWQMLEAVLRKPIPYWWGSVQRKAQIRERFLAAGSFVNGFS